MNLRELLEGVACGEIAVDEAERFLDSYGFVEVGFHRLDLHRGRRTGLPEVVFGKGKSLEQLREIGGWFVERREPLLMTKLDVEKGMALASDFPQFSFDPPSGLLRHGSSRRRIDGRIAVVAAGSSDVPVAEEAFGTLSFFGVEADRVYDCGVAGLHRLFASASVIDAADVIVVVAGMEGALPSVVAGMFRQPVVAVPTSIGYGSNFEGLSALLTMLNSCAPGITVVNIDNGFGAAVAARSMLAMAERKNARELSSSE